MTDWQLYDNAGDNCISPHAACCKCGKPLAQEPRYARRAVVWAGCKAASYWYACVECVRGGGRNDVHLGHEV